MLTTQTEKSSKTRCQPAGIKFEEELDLWVRALLSEGKVSKFLNQ